MIWLNIHVVNLRNHLDSFIRTKVVLVIWQQENGNVQPVGRHSDAISKRCLESIKVLPMEQTVRPKQAVHDVQSFLVDMKLFSELANGYMKKQRADAADFVKHYSLPLQLPHRACPI